MELTSPGSVIFHLGPFTLRYYGLMIATGFIIALLCAVRLAKKKGLSADTLVSLALWSFIAGIVGARIYYVLLSLPHFTSDPLSALAIWNGGLSIHGGIIGGIIAAALYLRHCKQPFLVYADVMGACIPLAQAVGRWGNFFNSEAYGLPVDENFPLRLFIPVDCRNLQYQASRYFHPTFLYESLWNLLVFLVLYFYFAKKCARYPGLTFFLYLALYSLGRMIIEPFRVDSVSYAMGMPVPQLVSAATLAAALCVMLHLYKKGPICDPAPGS